jgi:hypothetical protein
MVLMFVQFAIDRTEQKLLAKVDERAWTALAGRFQSLAGDEGTALAIARLGETLGRGSARLLESQEQAWQSLERTAAAGVRQLLDEAGDRIQVSLSRSLDASLARWADSLARTHDDLAARREARWTEAADSLVAAVRGLERHQDALAGQTSLLGEVVGATRDIATLERALDSNLAALSATGRFEETLTTLAAAVQLLAARTSTADHRTVDLQAARRVGKAA